MRASDQPMFIVWGPERTLLYNDAYAAILANKHPHALGRDFLEVWSEIRGDLEPIVAEAYAGRPVHMEDITLLMSRRGYPEETHFAFSYTPVRDEAGRVGGFFCACVETTAKVAAERSRADELAAQARLFENAPSFIAVLCGPEHRFDLANRAYRRLAGNRDCIGRTAREVFPELADQPFFDLLDHVYTTGNRHTATDTPIVLAQPSGLEERFLDFVYEPIRDDDGRITGIFVEGHDVTEAHRGREALREREERLRLIIDGAREYAILTTDTERRITSWSAGAERAFGLTADQAVGRLSDELFTPDDVNAGAPEREVETAVVAGSAPDQRWHQRADGSLVYINGSVHPLPPDEQGQPRGFLKIGRDETERRRREEELATTRRDLEQSEQRFRTALEIETVGTIYFDMAGRIIDANDAFLSISGYSREELERGDLTWQTLTPTEWIADSERAFAELKATGRTTPYEKQYLRRDGSRWWALFAAKLLPDGTGFEFVLDISDRKEAEARLRELNETLEEEVAARTAERDRMWETSPDLLLVIDFDGHFRRVNPAWTTLLGYAPEELVGHHVNEFVVPEDHRGTVEAYEFAAEGGRPAIENRYRHKDGSTRWISWVAAPAGDMTYATGRDVTLQKTQQLELVQTQEALRQSQKMEAIGQLTGGVAHDFNNLLTVIRSSADLLRRRELTEERRRRYVDAISDTADRAAKLTGQLLAFARRQALRPEVFDVAARVDGVAEMLRTVLGARVELTIEGRCRPCPVEADAAQFETALVNMAVNARDAMDGEGRLTIGIDEATGVPPVRGHSGASGEFVVVSVADTGSGIPHEVMERIFEPFFTTKDVGKGTGLGLSQVFGFAKQSGGEVAVDSEPGLGTTFRLYLPKVDAVARDDEAGATGSAAHVGNGRVLVVEDNAAVGEFAAQLLEDLGYTTVLAGNAGEALGMLEGTAAPFDLVFSDVVMPGMDGVDFGRRVRERWPGLPVVLTSGYSHVLASDARHGFPVLHKPYSVEELSRVLRQASWNRARRPIAVGT